MTNFSQQFCFYLTKQFNIALILVLAVVSFILLCTFFLQFRWNFKQITIYSSCIKKILSLSHKVSSKNFKNSFKKQPSSKQASLSMVSGIQNGEDSKRQMQRLDPVLDEILVESVLGGYLKQISPYLIGNSGEIKNALRASQSNQALSMYQPFLILCVLIFNFNQIMVVVRVDQNDGNKELQPIDSNLGGKYYTAISMITISSIIYLFLNVSNLFIRLITSCQLNKNNKSPQSYHTHSKPAVLPEKKIFNQTEHIDKVQPKEEINPKNCLNPTTRISFKLRNSFHLLHLLHTIPLFISIGIIVSLKF